MCGIVGYIGRRPAFPVLFDGLKKLEYRGYDSCGMCVSSHGQFSVVKRIGRVGNLQSYEKNLMGNIGIAHTRWATHGAPTELNAHPHLDCTGRIAIVHNGIVENYHALKTLLRQEGHVIVSDTDSEIIAHLIEKFYTGDIEQATAKALMLMDGTFGLLVMESNNEKIIAARRGSPLIMAIGDNEMFLASDTSAIEGYAKEVVYLNDGEIAIVTGFDYQVKNVDGHNVDKKVETVALNVASIEKGNFKHFMLKEIFQQPESIKNTFKGRVNNGMIKLSIADHVHQAERITIVACGTSYYAAILGKYLIEKLAGIPVNVDLASEFRYRNPIVSCNELVIAISQSGETADTLAAIKEAKRKKANTLGIVNVVGSTISREVDSGIYLHAGPEIGVASTKAFTCQAAALTLLALYLQQHRTGQKPDQNVLDALLQIPEKIKEVLSTSLQIRALGQLLMHHQHFLYLGRGVNFPVAQEGALKLKEISYIHAEGMSAAEIKHGPIALVDKNMPALFLAPRDELYGKVLNSMQEVKAREGIIIAVVNQGDDWIEKLADIVICVPSSVEELTPIINIIPLQLLAYHIADLKGLDVDKPRNLAKSVTVE